MDLIIEVTLACVRLNTLTRNCWNEFIQKGAAAAEGGGGGGGRGGDDGGGGEGEDGGMFSSGRQRNRQSVRRTIVLQRDCRI